MKDITLEVFSDLDDALLWMENELFAHELTHPDIKAEISLIDGKWRVGIILNDRQYEFKFKESV
jgi:hypothetical protein